MTTDVPADPTEAACRAAQSSRHEMLDAIDLVDDESVRCALRSALRHHGRLHLRLGRMLERHHPDTPEDVT